MNVYETVFMTRPDVSDTQIKALTDKYSKLIKDHKGDVLKTEDWGTRSLAYKINKNRKARYVLIEYKAEGPTVQEIERLIRIEDDIMRSLTVKLDEPTKGPSVIMAKNNDNDDSEKEAA